MSATYRKAQCRQTSYQVDGRHKESRVSCWRQAARDRGVRQSFQESYVYGLKWRRLRRRRRRQRQRRRRRQRQQWRRFSFPNLIRWWRFQPPTLWWVAKAWTNRLSLLADRDSKHHELDEVVADESYLSLVVLVSEPVGVELGSVPLFLQPRRLTESLVQLGLEGLEVVCRLLSVDLQLLTTKIIKTVLIFPLELYVTFTHDFDFCLDDACYDSILLNATGKNNVLCQSVFIGTLGCE